MLMKKQFYASKITGNMLKTILLAALVFMIIPAMAQADYTPVFTGGSSQSLQVCINSGADPINALLQIYDADAGQTETWTVSSTPAHGTVGTGGTQSSTGGNVSPTGFSYTPTTGYTGTDAFTIQVSDGAGGSATTTVNVTVNALPSVASISGNTSLSTILNTTLSDATTSGIWTSATTGIAAIGSSTGLVIGVSAGTGLISYTVSSGGCSASVTANVTVKTATNGLNFHGANDYVDIGAVLSANHSYSKEAWIYVNSFSEYDNIISSQDYPFWIPAGHLCAANNFIADGAVTASANVHDTDTFPLSQWVHVAVTYDAPSTTMKLYKNGVLVSANTSAPGYTNSDMQLGAWESDNFFDGAMDEVRIWDTAVSQEQILANMNTDLPQQTHLIAYYRFDQGTAGGNNSSLIAAYDYSGNGHCGILYNFALTGSTSNYITGAEGNYNAITFYTPGTTTGTAEVCPAGGTTTLYNSSPGGVWSSAGSNVSVVGSTGVVTGINAGTAVVSYTLNCLSALTTVTVNPLLGITVSDDTTICNGTNTTIIVSGSSSSYTWTPAASLSSSTGTSVTATPSVTTTYTVTGTNPVGCNGTANVTVTVLPLYPITASASAGGSISPSGTTNICSGTSQAYAITPNTGYHVSAVTVDAGSVGAVTTYTFTAVSASHSISATFAPDCVAPTVSCAGNITQGAATGACNATVTYSAASVTGTSPTITYSSNSGTSFPVGVTTVTAMATNGCGTANCYFTVTVTPNVLSVSATTTNVSCYGGSNGAITTSVSGGTGSYSYSWTGGGTSASRSSLVAGVYTVTVTDAGCSAESAATKVVTITQPAVLSLALATKSNGCHNANNGSINTNVAGGTSSYTYNWSNGSHTANLSGLSPATYSVTVIDAHSCTVSGSYAISNPSALSLSATETDAVCHGGNGTIATTAGGGTSPYTYLWSNGATTATLTATAGTYTVTATDAAGCTKNGTYTIHQPAAITLSSWIYNPACNGESDGYIGVAIDGASYPVSFSWNTGGLGYSSYNDLYDVPAGIYTVTATDANGCTATQKDTITQPTAITVTGTVTNASCHGASTGSITTSVSGGTPSYGYTWSWGAHCANATSVGAGTYSVLIYDGNYCSSSASFTVTEPTAISRSATITNVTCNGSSNGAIHTAASGGAAPYTYSWCGYSVHDSDRTGLSAGSYNLTVTDAHSCTSTGSYTVTQPSAITPGISVSPTYCATGGDPYTIYLGYGASSVTLSASASGGSSGYSYSWSPGAGSGSSITVSPTTTTTYTLTVTDENGCTATTTQVIIVTDIRCGDGENVYICHYGSTISCSPSAVCGHIAHGDYYGDCHSSGSGHSGCRTTPATSTGSTGITVTTDDVINAYPNPNDGSFSITIPVEHKDAQIMVTDLTGKVITQSTVTENAGAPIPFTLGNVAKGMYILKVTAGATNYVTKLIVR